MVDGKISFNLETLERNAKSCNPAVLENALDVGADMEKMDSTQLASLRASISKYKEDCTCVRIPAPTKERARETATKLKETAKEYIGIAEKKAAPTLEKIKEEIERAKTKSSPKIEKFKEEISPKIEKAKSGIYPTFEKIKSRLST